MTLIVLGLVSAVAWFISLLSGGGALILIPLVNLLFGVQAVAPIITLGILVGNTQRAFFFRQNIQWPLIWWYCSGASLGALLGVYAFTQIDLEWLQILIGIALLLMMLNYWFGTQSYSFTVKAWQFLPLGFLNAFGSGLIGSTGPIMNPVYLNYGLVKEDLIATKSLNGAIVHGIKIAAYLALGVLNWPYFLYGMVIGLAVVPANLLGQFVLDQMSKEQFRQMVWTFAGIGGVLMIWGQRQLLSFG